MYDRTCNDCNFCCEGWIHGQAYEHKFYFGKPCFYLKNKTCSIYGNHPLGCKSFYCEWVKDLTVPEEYKPTNTNVMAVRSDWRGHSFIGLIADDKMPNQEFINFYTYKYFRNEIQNLVMVINGEIAFIRGTDEFTKEFSRISMFRPTS